MVEIHNIHNFKVLTIPVKNSKVIYVQGFVLSGYMNETRSNLGIGHLLEHILGDSWKRCNDDCAQYWGERGIISNAYTDETTINYHIEALEKDYKEIIEYIIKITTTPQITESRIEKEKMAVRQELKREMNTPTWKITDEMTKTIYSHIGLKNSGNLPLQIKNLKKFDKKTLVDFCKKIYTPKNIMFIVSGKFHKKNVLQIFNKFLPKNMRPGKRNIHPHVLSNITRPVTTFIKDAQAKVAEICMIFSTPIYPWEKDTIYYPLIQDILGEGMHSLLLRRLRSELELVYNIHVSIDTSITGTHVILETTSKEKNVASIINNVKSILRDLQDGNLEDAHLSRAKDIFLIKDEEECKTAVFYGDIYGEQYAAQLYKDNPTIVPPAEKMRLIKNATKKDIIRVCRRLFPLNKSIVIYQCAHKQKV